jgi:hypothetical protein
MGGIKMKIQLIKSETKIIQKNKDIIQIQNIKTGFKMNILKREFETMYELIEKPVKAEKKPIEKKEVKQEVK